MSRRSQFETASWKLDRPPTGIRFNPDGSRLQAYDGRTIYTWSVPGFQEIQRYSVEESEYSREGHCRFINGGKSILLVASDDNSEEGIHHLTVRELESFTLNIRGDVHLEHYGLVAIQFNRGRPVTPEDCGGMSHFVGFPSCIRIRSVRFDHSAFAERGTVRSMVFSPDESELWGVCGFDEPDGYREYLAAFEPRTGKGIRRQKPNKGSHIDGLQLTPRADALLAVEEEALCLHDPKSWELIRQVDLGGSLQKRWGRSGPALAFAPSDPLVALSCEYNTSVCIADYESPKLIGVFDVDEDFCVRLLTFSPDSRYLAVASYDAQNEVRVWDVSEAMLRQRRTKG